MKEITRSSIVEIAKTIVDNAIYHGVISEEVVDKFNQALKVEEESDKQLDDMPLHQCFYAFSLIESFIDAATSSNGNALTIDFDTLIDDGEVSVELFVDSIKEIIASLVGLITNAISYLGCETDKPITISHEIIVLKETSIKLQKHDYPIGNIIPFLIKLNTLITSDVGAREMSRLCSPTASHMIGQNVFTNKLYMDSLSYDNRGNAQISNMNHFGITRKLVETMHLKGIRSINKAAKFMKHIKEVMDV